jgi:predicted ATPase/DNA-binding SARP family transcriptional activator/Tfp pilus assembly protein PilF
MTPELTPTPILRCRFFGPLAIELNGWPLPRVFTRKDEWLLVLLALHRGNAVERRWLAGQLWPDSTESTALLNLRKRLWELRKALGAESRRLVIATESTLGLDLTDCFVDVLEFDRLIQRGDEASLEQAVALYRGPLLEDCYEDWIHRERERRHHVFVLALETLGRRAFEARDWIRAERHLRLLVTIEPFRESACRLLMQVMAGRGDAPSAIAVYRDLQRRLLDEQQAEPDTETRKLFEELRAAARRRALSAPHVAPSALGRPPSHNLPNPMTRFLGRSQELSELGHLVCERRLVTLTGEGGTGKTRLALEVAARRVLDLRDGVWLVELASVAGPEHVAQTVAQVLKVKAEPEIPLGQTLAEAMRDRELLLVLDNCEHLCSVTAALVSDLLRSCSLVSVLSTSRVPLGVPGEQQYRVPPLSVPEAGSPPNELEEFGSIALFVDRAQLRRPSFALAATNAETVVQICRRLDGLPLAIELAAARLDVLHLETIARELHDRYTLLALESASCTPRHATLRAALAWSYSLLSEAERRLFAALSAFAGGFTLEAVETICASETGTGVDPRGLLLRMVASSLVSLAGQDGEPRYRLLEPMREYAAEKLSQTNRSEPLFSRHREYYLAFAEQAVSELFGKEQAIWLGRLDREHDNLLTALARSIERRDAASALRLGAALWRYWDIRGRWADGRKQLALALSLPTVESRTMERAAALHGAGLLARNMRDMATAHASVEESLAIRRELKDRAGAAASLHLLGLFAYTHDNDVARRCYQESLAIRREIGDRWAIAGSLTQLGNIDCDEGKYDAARSQFMEALSIFQEFGDQSRVAAVRSNLARIDEDQGEYESARKGYEAGLAVYRNLNDRPLIAELTASLAGVILHKGEFEYAFELYQEGLAIHRDLGNKEGMAVALNGLGLLRLRRGDPEAARPLLEEGLALCREWERKPGIVQSLLYLGDVALSESDPSSARSYFEEALPIARECKSKRSEAALLRGLGDVAREVHEFSRALSFYQESLQIRQELGDKLGVAESLERCAELARWREGSETR